MNALQRIFCLFLAGGAGALARWSLCGLVQRLTGSLFPWGTLVANSLGCFFFGLIWVLATERMVLSSELKLIVLTGFMGAFTTFSTFTAETGQMLARAEWLSGAANAFGGLAIGLFCFFLGLALGRWV